MEVIIYTKNNCSQCGHTKRYLRAIAVPYQEKNIEAVPAYREEAVATGFTSLPIVMAGEEVFSGHQPAKLEELFGGL